ncbi:MAG: PilZ domain-containing protein [Candidatus Omnitrophica bacterium]|nr:PilZ domain-containing protein [Candidatus Omnitrophota bacterium]
MDEKRKFTRLEQEMPLRQKVENCDIVECLKTQDISTGGLRIATDTPLNIGTKLNIEVNITGSSSPYYAIGEVVWYKEKDETANNKFDIGIRFVRIVSKSDLDGF